MTTVRQTGRGGGKTTEAHCALLEARLAGQRVASADPDGYVYLMEPVGFGPAAPGSRRELPPPVPLWELL